MMTASTIFETINAHVARASTTEAAVNMLALILSTYVAGTGFYHTDPKAALVELGDDMSSVLNYFERR
jgi:hypothetical protein